MKLPNLPVESFEDITHDFEVVQVNGIFTTTTLGGDLTGTLPNPTVANGKITVPKLATGIVLELAVTGTERKVAYGTAVINFPNSVTATQLSVTHGLGTTPQQVVATVDATAAVGFVIVAYTGNYGATTFSMNANSASSLNGNVNIHWIAIG